MTIDIQHVAKLAKLRLEEDQAQRFAKDMENIVSMVQQLPSTTAPLPPTTCRTPAPSLTPTTP